MGRGVAVRVGARVEVGTLVMVDVKVVVGCRVAVAEGRTVAGSAIVAVLVGSPAGGFDHRAQPIRISTAKTNTTIPPTRSRWGFPWIQLEVELIIEVGVCMTLERKVSDESTAWISLDFIDVVVHIFTDEARDYYRLESLWRSVPQESWQG